MRRPIAYCIRLILLITFLFITIGTTFGQYSAWRQVSTAQGLTVGLNPLNPNTAFIEGANLTGDLYVTRNKGGSWQFVGHLGGNQIRQIIVHPNDTLTMFYANEDGVGLRKSTNGGVSWRVVLPGYSIDGESMALDPVHPDTIYAGDFSGAVYRSTDRGETWIYRGSNGGPQCAMAVRPDSSNIILSGRGNGHISKSTDGGATWRIVQPNFSGGEVPKIEISPTNPLIAYATTNGADNDTTLAAWKTTDGGEHWFKLPLRGINIWSLAVAPNDPNTAYIGTFSDIIRTVYKTTDGGQTWNDFGIRFSESSDMYSWKIKIHPLDADVVWMAVTSPGVFGPGFIYRLSSTVTTIEGAVIDGANGDTVRNGFFRDLNSPYEATISLAAAGGRFVTGYFNESYTTFPVMHVEAFPYYSKDTAINYVIGSTVKTTISLEPLHHSFITGDVRNRATAEKVSARVFVSYTDPSGSHTITTNTDVNGHFEFDDLFVTHLPELKYTSVSIEPVLPFAQFHDTSITLDEGGLNLAVELDTIDVLLVGAAGAGNYSDRYVQALSSLGVTSYDWKSDLLGTAPMQLGSLLRKRMVIFYTGNRLTALTTAEIDSLTACLNSGCHLFITGRNIVEMNQNTVLMKDYLGLRLDQNTNLIVLNGTPGDMFHDMFWFNESQPSSDRMTIVNPRVKPILNYGASGQGGIAGVRLDCTGNGSAAVVFGFGFEGINGTSNQSAAEVGKIVMGKIVGYFADIDANGFQTVTTDVRNGWNMVSAPISVIPTTIPAIFPSITSHAFRFEGTYVPTDTLNIGQGYWLKFSEDKSFFICGTLVTSETTAVRDGWNMIGSISVPISTTNITSVPPALTTSQFFGFDGSAYLPADSIEPGKGYWVRTSGTGRLTLSGSGIVSAAGRIRIVPTSELPPSPPSETDVAHRVSHIPQQFSLGQNYPNPFNPVTRIRFEIRDAGFVVLKVFDVLGREVATIVNEELEPGEYTRTWDASRVPSGVYYYKLSAGTYTEARKMLILR